MSLVSLVDHRHARGRAQCRQKCRERGYYHLHRQLDDALFFHVRFVSLRFALVEGGGWRVKGDYFCLSVSPPKLGGARGGLNKRYFRP